AGAGDGWRRPADRWRGRRRGVRTVDRRTRRRSHPRLAGDPGAGPMLTRSAARRVGPPASRPPLVADKLREERGVFGIRTGGAAAAAPYVHLGLYALQHRGQESAGIATFDGRQTHLVKDMGLVANVFTPERLASLRGSTGIGHVRYSTMG